MGHMLWEIWSVQEEMCPKVRAKTSSWNLKPQWSKQGHTYAWGFLVCFGFQVLVNV